MYHVYQPCRQTTLLCKECSVFFCPSAYVRPFFSKEISYEYGKR